MIKLKSILSVLAALSLAACASSPSRELVDARAAYARVSSGAAAQSVPAEVHKARVSLDAAETAFDNDSGNQRDLAYVAERKAQLAEALAMKAEHAGSRTSAEATLASDKDADARATKHQLNDTRSDLANSQHNATDEKRRAAEANARTDEANTKTAEANTKTDEANTKTAEANAKAADADKRAADSDAKLKSMQLELAKWAAVKEEPRGVVITLSGSVLFASNKATLLPEANTRLTQVAAALMQTKDRHLEVQGYTDSQGKDAYNVDLSQRRADAVRVHLIADGYPGDLITARGAGKASPIADNATAEGRANNRRVEIVVQPAAVH